MEKTETFKAFCKRNDFDKNTRESILAYKSYHNRINALNREVLEKIINKSFAEARSES